MFKYIVTIILPTYNLEKYIEIAINSIKKQTLPFEKIEVIIVDDGSKDKTLEICDELNKKHSNIVLLKSEHKGVSSARNQGIRRAQGKYIMFLDGDDSLTVETVESVVEFFDSNYYKVDLVTYPLKSYKNSIDGEILPEHYRYHYLKESQIYDLEEYPYVTQTTMNVIVKNRFKENIVFNEHMTFSEDQKYCFDNLKRIFKLGFCNKGCYQYIRHDESSSSVSLSAIELFESSMAFWESLFKEYVHMNIIPKYIQAAYINDLAWKNMSNVLFPYHYRTSEKFSKSIDRIIRLLQMVEVDTICNHLAVDEYHKYYFLKMKKENTVALEEKTTIAICAGKKLIKSVDSVELFLEKTRFIQDRLVISGFLRSPIFEFIKDFQCVEKIIYDDGHELETPVETFLSSKSWHRCHTLTNSMWAFKRDITELENIKNISYYVRIGMTRLKVIYNFYTLNTPFYERKIEKKLIGKNFYLRLEDNSFCINKANKNVINDYEKKEIEYYQTTLPDIAYIRANAKQQHRHQHIWLYYDVKGKLKDNAFYQFCHDCNKNDGITRYYITQNEVNHYSETPYQSYMKNIIPFGKHQHQILFLCCEKIITAYIEPYNIIPFSNIDFHRISDVLKFEVVYLQHGVLHAYLPWKYTYLGNLADQVVISSEYEKKIFTETYHYPENTLIMSGMPRFDLEQKTEVSNNLKENYILYIPSWRQYLVTLDSSGTWNAKWEQFWKSVFFHGIKSLFESDELKKILKRENTKLVIQMHPIFYMYKTELEKYGHERIIFAEGDIYDNEHCKAIITDYSSYVYDFVKLKKTIIYFFPDEVEFYAGLNGYYRLTLPLEEGFGPITRNIKELENALKHCSKNQFVPEKLYMDRMKNFLIDNDVSCERIYQKIYKI